MALPSPRTADSEPAEQAQLGVGVWENVRGHAGASWRPLQVRGRSVLAQGRERTRSRGS